MDLFSSRRRAITRKTRTLVAAFETKFGREPNSLELDRLQRSATFATRNAKSHEGETVEERLTRWDAQLRSQVAGGLAQLARDVAERRHDGGCRAGKPVRDVIEEALAEVQEKQAAWTASDLTRAISNALPDDLGKLSPEKVTDLLTGLTAEALQLAVPLDADRPGVDVLPSELRLDNGNSAYQSPGAALYATPAHVRSERVLAAAATMRGGSAVSAQAAGDFVAALAGSGRTLGADQAAAVRGILTSGAKVESLIGPAGTGKSFVVGALARAWQDPSLWGGARRRVVGLAASQIATEVLTDEGLTARNIARWLATQQRLVDGRPLGDDKAWQLRAGDLVVVDESAMADTGDLTAIHEHCRAAGAKLLLVGDHRQLAAVGAAGGMELVADAVGGLRHELTETRRFSAAWEGGASLRLRDRDQTVLAEYHKHGRLIDGGAIEQTEQAAAKAWLADTLAGRHSLLIVDTNEQAARLSAQLRADLVRLGKVDEHAVPLGLQGTFAGRGDLIQARRNDRRLAGYAGNTHEPINREQYRVLNTLDDGGLVVAPITSRRDGHEHTGQPMTLPAHYVSQHVALGYASTVHAAQGMTVDTSHTVATGSTGAEALYVGLTRGRHSNTAHVVTRAVPDAPDGAPTGRALQAVHRSPQAVLAGAFETSDPQLAALAAAAESQAEADSVRTPGELLADALEIATAGRTATWLDELVADGHLTENQRTAIAAEDGAATLTTLLRRVELAGQDPRLVLTEAVTSRTLDDARQLTNVVHRRITNTIRLDPIGDTFTDRLPQLDDPQWATYLARLADAADLRQTELGRQVAEQAPQWAVEALGPVPAVDAPNREVWEHQAGVAAVYRDLAGVDDLPDALGPAPRPGQIETYAAWRAAWRALGRPEADRAEAEMSIGQLRVRVRAYDREQAWAPPYVANELAGTRQTAQQRRNDAVMRTAEADTARDHAERVRLLAEAEEAAALADALDARVEELKVVDEARGHWYAHTAGTRNAAERARAELSARQADADPTTDDREVTPQEWLARHEAATTADDPHRVITNEHELADAADAREHDKRTAAIARTDAGANAKADAKADADADAAETLKLAVHAAAAPDGTRLDNTEEPLTDNRLDQADVDGAADTDTADLVSEETDEQTDEQTGEQTDDQELPDTSWDIRQEAAAEPERDDGHDPDAVRVPSSDETAESVRRAQRALTELKQRRAIEDRRAADDARERADELANWREDDQTDHADTAADHGGADHSNDAEDRPAHETPDAVDDSAPVLEVTRSDDY